MGKIEQKKLFNVRKEIISRMLEKAYDSINRDDEPTARKNLSILMRISSYNDSY